MSENHVKIAAQARTNLTIFHAVIAVLEGGTITRIGTAQDDAQRIIRVCRSAAQKQLGAYDRSVALAAKGDAG